MFNKCSRPLICVSIPCFSAAVQQTFLSALEKVLCVTIANKSINYRDLKAGVFRNEWPRRIVRPTPPAGLNWHITIGGAIVGVAWAARAAVPAVFVVGATPGGPLIARSGAVLEHQIVRLRQHARLAQQSLGTEAAKSNIWSDCQDGERKGTQEERLRARHAARARDTINGISDTRKWSEWVARHFRKRLERKRKIKEIYVGKS